MLEDVCVASTNADSNSLNVRKSSDRGKDGCKVRIGSESPDSRVAEKASHSEGDIDRCGGRDRRRLRNGNKSPGPRSDEKCRAVDVVHDDDTNQNSGRARASHSVGWEADMKVYVFEKGDS
jgi:hypothetical protein